MALSDETRDKIIAVLECYFLPHQLVPVFKDLMLIDGGESFNETIKALLKDVEERS